MKSKTATKQIPPYGEFYADDATVLEHLPEPLRGVLINMECTPTTGEYELDYIDNAACYVTVHVLLPKPLPRKKVAEAKRATSAIGRMSGRGERIEVHADQRNEFDSNAALMLSAVPEPWRGVLAKMNCTPTSCDYEVSFIDNKYLLIGIFVHLHKALTDEEFAEVKQAQRAVGYPSGQGNRLGI
jgi:hypothetical protein